MSELQLEPKNRIVITYLNILGYEIYEFNQCPSRPYFTQLYYIYIQEGNHILCLKAGSGMAMPFKRGYQ